MEQWARDPLKEIIDRGWSMVKDCPGDGYEDITNVQGIWKKVLHEAPADAAQPKEGSWCHVNYEYFYQGERFDKSDDDTPLEVIAGSGMTTPGMEQGMQSMRIGERARFVFDPLFSFRENGFPPRVPAHAIVELEMELVDFMGPWTEEEKIAATAEFKMAGNELFKKKEFRAALKKYNRGLDIVGRRKRRLPPSQQEHEAGQEAVRLQILQNVMLCWHSMGNSERSLDFANQIIRMKPDNAKARFRLSRYEGERHNYHQAREHLAALDEVDDAAVRKEVAADLRRLAERERAAREKSKKAAAGMVRAFAGCGDTAEGGADAPPAAHADPEASPPQPRDDPAQPEPELAP